MYLNAIVYVLVQETIELSKYSWALAVMGVGLAFLIAFGYRRRNDREVGYESLIM